MQTINCFDFIASRESVLICHFILSFQPSTLQVQDHLHGIKYRFKIDHFVQTDDLVFFNQNYIFIKF